jgi:dienelactone hydrolase
MGSGTGAPRCYPIASMKFPRAVALIPLLAAMAGAAAPSEQWPNRRLFTRPFLWGTPPSAVKWAKDGSRLAFLWNSDGQPLVDLYSYNAATSKLTRVTHLEPTPDAYNQPEVGERQKPYQLPQAGLNSFTLSADGTQAAYSYGRDWRSGVYLDMGGPDLNDLLGQVDYAKSLGNIDMQRIGIWGWSYGGLMTDMAMFREPDVFRAGVSVAAVTQWENYNASYTQQRLNRPQDNPEAYRRSSPITYSSRLKYPLLIVHGIVDDNVLFQDDIQLTEKLIHEGRPFEQIFYPAEKHSFARDETLIDCFQRAADFFDRNMR